MMCRSRRWQGTPLQCLLLLIVATLSNQWILFDHSVHAFTCFQSQARFQRHHHPQPVRVLLSASATKKDNGKEEDSTNPPQNKKKISHLANDANLSSLTENNPTWDQNIAALLEYNQTHGTVNLPQYSKEYPNLGLWVFNLRQQKGRLTKKQIQQLNDIGFLWKESKMDKEDRQWLEMFMRLKAYKEQHGHCLVPVRYYEPDQKPKLGKWVANQRKMNTQGKIRKDREDMLDSIGFVWRLKAFKKLDRPDLEELWEKRYLELIEFKEEHDHTNVPQDYPSNEALGFWVNNQRKRKRDGTLRKDRVPLLDKIGFIWDFEPIWDEAWLEQYEELKTYYQEIASYKEMNENSPEGSKAATRPVLGINIQKWAFGQRRRHARGDLEPDRKNKLDKIGFDWWE